MEVQPLAGDAGIEVGEPPVRVTAVQDANQEQTRLGSPHDMIRHADHAKQATNEDQKFQLCTFQGDSTLVTVAKAFLLAIVFVALLVAGMQSTDVKLSDLCNDVSGSDSNGSCCPAMTSVNDMISAAHSCGTFTILEAFVVLVAVSVHIACMAKKTATADGRRTVCWRLEACISKAGSGLIALFVASFFVIPALINLAELDAKFADFSEACDGNEEWGHVEDVIRLLTIVHIVVLWVAAICAVLGCIGLRNKTMRANDAVSKADAPVGGRGGCADVCCMLVCLYLLSTGKFKGAMIG